MAELIIAGRRATLRIQDRERRITTLNLAEGDALTVDAKGAWFDLLDLHSARLAHPIEGVAPDGLLVDLYFQSREPLSLQSAEALTKQMLDIAALQQVTIYIRRDLGGHPKPAIGGHLKTGQ